METDLEVFDIFKNVWIWWENNQKGFFVFWRRERFPFYPHSFKDQKYVCLAGNVVKDLRFIIFNFFPGMISRRDKGIKAAKYRNSHGRLRDETLQITNPIRERPWPLVPIHHHLEGKSHAQGHQVGYCQVDEIVTERILIHLFIRFFPYSAV